MNRPHSRTAGHEVLTKASSSLTLISVLPPNLNLVSCFRANILRIVGSLDLVRSAASRTVAYPPAGTSSLVSAS